MGHKGDVEVVPFFLVDLAPALEVDHVENLADVVTGQVQAFEGFLEVLVVGIPVLIGIRKFVWQLVLHRILGVLRGGTQPRAPQA
jgi:hypothetical protein